MLNSEGWAIVERIRLQAVVQAEHAYAETIRLSNLSRQLIHERYRIVAAFMQLYRLYDDIAVGRITRNQAITLSPLYSNFLYGKFPGAKRARELADLYPHEMRLP